METRICSDCGKEKELNNNNFEIVTQYHRSHKYSWFKKRCRACRNLKEVRFYSLTYDKVKKKASQKRFEQSIKGKILRKKYDALPRVRAKHVKLAKRYLAINPDKAKEYKVRQVKKQVDTLSNPYLRRILIANTSLLYSDITPELIELKRKQLKLRRLCKQQQLQM